MSGNPNLPWEKGWRKGNLGDNKEVVLKNLLDFKKVMEKWKIPFFFIWGTLLGAIRENDFIEYDDDIDLGSYLELKNSEAMVEVRKEMRELGFWVPEEDMPAGDDVFIRDGEKIELWWYEKVGDTRVYDKERTKNVYVPADWIDPIRAIIFHGHAFWIPAEWEKMLIQTYGEDWETPIKNYSGKGVMVGNKKGFKE